MINISLIVNKFIFTSPKSQKIMQQKTTLVLRMAWLKRSNN